MGGFKQSDTDRDATSSTEPPDNNSLADPMGPDDLPAVEGVYQTADESMAAGTKEPRPRRTLKSMSTILASLVLLSAVIDVLVGAEYLAKHSALLEWISISFAILASIMAVGIYRRYRLAIFAYSFLSLAIVVLSPFGLHNIAIRTRNQNAADQHALVQSQQLARQYRGSKLLGAKQKALLLQQIASQQAQLRQPIKANHVILIDLETLVLPVDIGVAMLLPPIWRLMS